MRSQRLLCYHWELSNHFAGFDEAAEFFLGGELVLAVLCGGRSHFLIRDRQSLQIDDTQIQRLAVVAVHSRGCLPDLALLKSHAAQKQGSSGLAMLVLGWRYIVELLFLNFVTYEI